MVPMHELPIVELWTLLKAGDVDELTLLQLDVARFLELQRLARAEGVIPLRTWEAVPGEPTRRQLPVGMPLCAVGHAPDGEPVLMWLPHNGRDLPRPPRGQPGAPRKLTDDVLRRHVRAHPRDDPRVSLRQRARLLTAELGLQHAPLHRSTIARRLRALT
jgi:hypothetical protein